MTDSIFQCCLKSIYHQGWRDGPVVQRMAALPEDLDSTPSSSQPPVTLFPPGNLMLSSALPCSPRTLDIHVVYQAYMQPKNPLYITPLPIPPPTTVLDSLVTSPGS